MHIDKKSEYEQERIPGSKRTTVNILEYFFFKYVSIHFLLTKKKSYHTINLYLTFSTYDFPKKVSNFLF